MKNISTHLHTKSKIFTAEHPAERGVLQALVFSFGLLLCAYLYFVSASVLNVMAQLEASHRSASLEGTIGTLEQQYFALAQAVSPGSAASEGLTPLVATDYIYKPGTVGVASVSINAI